jgi:hypothetical protein
MSMPSIGRGSWMNPHPARRCTSIQGKSRARVRCVFLSLTERSPSPRVGLRPRAVPSSSQCFALRLFRPAGPFPDPFFLPSLFSRAPAVLLHHHHRPLSLTLSTAGKPGTIPDANREICSGFGRPFLYFTSRLHSSGTAFSWFYSLLSLSLYSGVFVQSVISFSGAYNLTAHLR